MDSQVERAERLLIEQAHVVAGMPFPGEPGYDREALLEELEDLRIWDHLLEVVEQGGDPEETGQILRLHRPRDTKKPPTKPGG